MENTIYEQNKPPVEYAGFWWRFLAYIIDDLIIGAVSWIFALPILAVFGVSMYSLKEAGMDTDNAELLVLPIILAASSIGIIAMVLQWLYFALMESSKHQGTLGKIVLKIKVTDLEGKRVSFARATGRYFGKILSGMIMYIGYIMAGFTERKQALHDMLASCLVIKE